MSHCLLPLLGTLVLASSCASVSSLLPKAPVPVAIQAQAELPNRFVQPASLSISSFTGDALLQSLISQIPQSPDVLIAESRLREATARLQVARAGLLPNLTGTTTVSSSGVDGAKGTNSAVLGSTLQVPIDLFGTNRNRAAASAARLEESTYVRARTLALTTATLRQLYISLRTAQAQIAVTRTNLASANDTLSLVKARQSAGLETGLGVAQATNNRDAIAARLPGFEQNQIAARLGIEALLGQLPESLASNLATVSAVPRFDLASADTAPAQWLVNRADLAAAASRLKAAGLEARAAQKDRYPNLSLTTLISGTSASQGPTGAAGNVSLNLLSTLFDFGRLDALSRLASAQAGTEAALYKQAVTNAISDVEVQASRTARAGASLDAQKATVASAQDQARLSQVRYTSGLSDFLPVLTAQRAVYEAQSAQVQFDGEIASAQAALLLALGF